MSLIAYILSSILLSWLGLAVYLGFKRVGIPLGARRYLLWLVVGLSLLLPALPPFDTFTSASPAAHTAPVPIQAPSTVHDFCHCSDPGAKDLIRYQASKVNDILLAYRPWIWGIFAGILGLVMIRFSASLLRLLWLTRKYAREYITVAGQHVRLVRGFPGVQAGALRLGGRFIFWQDALDDLPAQEREAILLHELSHIRQWNTYERLVMGLVQSVWFLNPAYYFIFKELEQLSEFNADRFVVNKLQDAKAYARLLLKMKTSPALAMVPLFKGGMLKARVQAVLDPHPQARVNFGAALLLGLALLLPGELFAENIIHDQIREIAVYEFLTEANHQTGKEEFCKKCTYEAVEACY